MTELVNEHEEMETLSFEDEEGQEVSMIVLQRFAVEGNQYVLLLDRDSDEADTYVFRQDGVGEEATYESVEDEEEWTKVQSHLDELSAK